jgi:hypothetical protein
VPGDDDAAGGVFLTALQDLLEKFAEMGKNHDDDDFALALLGSFPSSYDTTISDIIVATDCNNAEQAIRLVTNEYNQHIIKKGTTGTERLPQQTLRNSWTNATLNSVTVHRLGYYRSDCWYEEARKKAKDRQEEMSTATLPNIAALEAATITTETIEATIETITAETTEKRPQRELQRSQRC